MNTSGICGERAGPAGIRRRRSHSRAGGAKGVRTACRTAGVPPASCVENAPPFNKARRRARSVRVLDRERNSRLVGTVHVHGGTAHRDRGLRAAHGAWKSLHVAGRMPAPPGVALPAWLARRQRSGMRTLTAWALVTRSRSGSTSDAGETPALRAPASALSQHGGSPCQVVVLRPVADVNCVTARWGGEQTEANDQSVRKELDSAGDLGEPAEQG
jgi:hypothetical protein